MQMQHGWMQYGVPTLLGGMYGIHSCKPTMLCLTVNEVVILGCADGKGSSSQYAQSLFSLIL